ncbi:DUF4174 domain-containing protein [Persicobacter psychrovividus]|uniref:DUF4174 domain-containing protein n=1 Tax=Persicobacter psychrovividus TaxID=387638 RepID=A0ABN6LBX4_9BACT|nr:hypothetical protein PEPS_29800 [Persicobacter psychrovividus]
MKIFGSLMIGLILLLAPAKKVSLDSLLTTNNVVLIFEGKHADKVQTQLKRFEQQRENLKQNNVLLFVVGRQEVKAWNSEMVLDHSPKNMHKRYNLPQGEFRVYLLDKKGKVRMKATEPFHPESLLAMFE